MKLDVFLDVVVKTLWGNHRFEYIISEAVGNSGGILCVWDPSFFLKEQHIVWDNFVALYGTWVPKKIKLLVITVYAPQPLTSKRALWDYLLFLINRWDGHCLVMGDFNEKLQALKKKIQAWINDYKQKHFSCVKDIRSKLHDIDIELDKGGSNDDILLARMDLMKRLNDIQSSEACDKFQKAKIHWAVEDRFTFEFFRKYWDTLGSDFYAAVEWPITCDEVRNAVWDCGENKSPGPDRFTFEFFRKYWDTLGSDFYAAVECDFRPISLIGILYKVVTKILANCLSSVISDLISEVQTAFLPNRQILVGPFIINEILSWCKYKKQQAMVFKVDFANAYDSVRWDFLDDVLDAFGFGSKWRSWIHGGLHSGMASVLINGSPSLEFKFQRGLKQGDPLAPYLFLFIMDHLHLSFSRAVDAGIFQGINVSEDLKISHLFYVDDAVFIGKWNDPNLSGITHILRCFSLLSGLNINLSKSHLLGAGVPFEDVNSATIHIPYPPVLQIRQNHGANGLFQKSEL
nr:RNA-directed DNA polymerase, eukaryota [Tanacetum cinerariifolium]